MNEIRKIYRMQAQLAQQQKRHVHVMPEDLIALLEDADELERVRRTVRQVVREEVGDMGVLYTLLARDLVQAGIDRVVLSCDYLPHLLRGAPEPLETACIRPEQMGGEEWAPDLKNAVAYLRKERTRLRKGGLKLV